MYRDTVFAIIVHPDVYHDAVFIGVVFLCSEVARALLCVSCLCWRVVSQCFLSSFIGVSCSTQKRVN